MIIWFPPYLTSTAHLRATRKSSVSDVFEVMARDFVTEFGTRRVKELKPCDFDHWLAGRRSGTRQARPTQ